MSDFVSGVQKFFTKDRVTIFIFFGVLVMLLMWYSGDKYGVMDNMESADLSSYKPPAQVPPVHAPPAQVPSAPESKPVVSSPAVQPAAGSGYVMQPIANPMDLLPSDQNSQWAALNPVNQSNPMIPDLLQAGYHIGLDTIGQTLKNPNYQLRSDPYIPKANVGPWNNSTYEPDLMRVPLEVGVGPQ